MTIQKWRSNVRRHLASCSLCTLLVSPFRHHSFHLLSHAPMSDAISLPALFAQSYSFESPSLPFSSLFFSSVISQHFLISHHPFSLWSPFSPTLFRFFGKVELVFENLCLNFHTLFPRGPRDHVQRRYLVLLALRL